VPLLFTENETNHERLFPGQENESQHVKDGINDFVVHGIQGAVNPEKQGTKAAAHFEADVNAGETAVIRLRLCKNITEQNGDLFGTEFDKIFADRKTEADEFYKSVTPSSLSEDKANVMRQALAGMLWSKQFFFFDGDNWLDEHQSNPLHKGYHNSRNSDWYHMLNEDIISMPDKWEYPWYAAWDLAFHAIPLSIVDPDFAEQQLKLMLRASYLHPNGQLPAYEWNFSDVNPPVHAWATLFLHRTVQTLNNNNTDKQFLKSAFNKLLLNFTWWVNRKDRFGKNVFEGGFLGLDNIGVFDRSAPLPTGGYLEQADGTAWMSLFSQNMIELAVELATDDIGKSYRGRRVVNGVSLRVGQGEVVGLLGPNGAGKTTTLRMVMGLITPTAGEIRVFGHKIEPGSEILSRIGSFVEGSGFLPHLSGKDNLDLYWKATNRPSGDQDGSVRCVLSPKLNGVSASALVPSASAM